MVCLITKENVSTTELNFLCHHANRVRDRSSEMKILLRILEIHSSNSTANIDEVLRDFIVFKQMALDMVRYLDNNSRMVHPDKRGMKIAEKFFGVETHPIEDYKILNGTNLRWLQSSDISISKAGKEQVEKKCLYQKGQIYLLQQLIRFMSSFVAKITSPVWLCCAIFVVELMSIF
jgi:hypothetical protein